jgi:hypothetical protein
LNGNCENIYRSINSVLVKLFVYIIHCYVIQYIYQHCLENALSNSVYSIHIRIRLRSERRERKRIREKRQEFYTYVHANRNSVLSSESRGRVGGQLRRSGRVVREAEEGRGWQRRTVVFHSHYRNVLPCALVAPRNKSSVTVTMAVRG